MMDQLNFLQIQNPALKLLKSTEMESITEISTLSDLKCEMWNSRSTCPLQFQRNRFIDEIVKTQSEELDKFCLFDVIKESLCGSDQLKRQITNAISREIFESNIVVNKSIH